MNKVSLRERALRLLSLSMYENADIQDSLKQPSFCELQPPSDQYILRMMVKGPSTHGWAIPPALDWLRSTIISLDEYQRAVMQVEHPYVYVTVRSGVVRSMTDDEWHVDGFSMRKPHAPEQNYIWSSHTGTEIAVQNFRILDTLDPKRHNIHQYFQRRVDPRTVERLLPQHLYLIDPYVVHRRPRMAPGTQRAFVRISFVPIEIEDDTCTPNPLLPAKHYGRTDIRKQLIDHDWVYG